jgi:hypothetical protein
MDQHTINELRDYYANTDVAAHITDATLDTHTTTDVPPSYPSPSCNASSPNKPTPSPS